MSVGKRIRSLRAKNGIANQEELAYLLGTARQTVSSWERDIFLPDGANLMKLSKVLNTSIAYILGETLTPDKDDKGAE
ncbi:MAG: helix-turn-helix transcriptional regulator, partial [Cloacibacillus sp.]